VRWLSALIKAERENCCDDIAVARSGKLNYLRALVACEEYKMPLTYAMTLKVGNRSLKNRAARIISNKNESLNNRERSFLAVCLIAAGIFAAVFASGGKAYKRTIAHQETAATKPTAVAAKKGSTKPTRATAEARIESDNDRTKSMINDLLKDAIIASPDNVSFKIGTDEFVVNYQKQPEAVYQKYRAKYVDTQYHGGDDWIWYCHFDTQKWALIVAHKAQPAADQPQTENITTGVFQGKEN
jgi:hypothetical protein